MATSLHDQSVTDALVQARTTRTKTVNGVAITTPFPSPEDWRDQWIYFLMVDRFNNPDLAAPPKHQPFDGEHNAFQGGTLEGVRQQLGYIKDLGAGAIWLTPVLKNCQFEDTTFHGYGIQDSLTV